MKGSVQVQNTIIVRSTATMAQGGNYSRWTPVLNFTVQHSVSYNIFEWPAQTIACTVAEELEIQVMKFHPLF